VSGVDFPQGVVVSWFSGRVDDMGVVSVGLESGLGGIERVVGIMLGLCPRPQDFRRHDSGVR